jgi:hypothetical protein
MLLNSVHSFLESYMLPEFHDPIGKCGAQKGKNNTLMKTRRRQLQERRFRKSFPLQKRRGSVQSPLCLTVLSVAPKGKVSRKGKPRLSKDGQSLDSKADF